MIINKLYKLYRILLDCLYYFFIQIIKCANKKIVFLLLTPVHGNLGDHAIAYAECQLLKELNIRYFEVPGEFLFKIMKKNRMSVFDGNPILISGGGYLGTLWFNDELLVRSIVKSNPESKILFFPNTIYFDDNDFGKKEKEESINIYNRHNCLKIYVREHSSYNTLREMGILCGLAPDMAMRLKFDDSLSNRSGCLVLLRKDCEKTISDYEINYISNVIKHYFGENIKWGDTVMTYRIPIRNRETVLHEFINEIKSFELVVTDRLHGMIFAAITGTPCIVINSKSPKVLGCYEWIKKLEYIKICDNSLNIQEMIEQMSMSENKYDNSKILDKFDSLIYDVKECAK